MTVKKPTPPKANPNRPVSKSKRPMPNPMYDRMSPKSVEERSTREMKKGGKVDKMAMGGKCRGMGAAKKGGSYGKNG